MASALGLEICSTPSLVAPDGSSISSGALNASGVRIAWAFQAQNTEPITHIGFLTGSVTGAQPTYRGSLQSLDASGNPDNTVLGGGSPASTTFTLAGSTWAWQALANAYTPSKGQWLSSVVDYSSGTIGGSNFANINYVSASNSFLSLSGDAGAPYGLTYNGTSWTKLSQTPFFGIRTANTRYGNPITAIGQTSAISTSGHRTVMKFRVPSGGLIDTFTVSRMRLFIDWPNSGSDIVFGVWNAAGTALQSDTHPRVNVGSSATTYVDTEFSSPATLSAGTWYYAGVQAAGTSFSVYRQTVDAADDKLAYN